MKTVGQNLIKAQWEIAHQSIDRSIPMQIPPVISVSFNTMPSFSILVSSLCHISLLPIHANENETRHTNAPKMAQKISFICSQFWLIRRLAKLEVNRATRINHSQATEFVENFAVLKIGNDWESTYPDLQYIIRYANI